MTPEREVIFNDKMGIVEMPSLTYAIDMDRENNDLFAEGQIVGYCDNISAMRQAVYKILSTERDRFLIYKDYGSEHFSLVGKPVTFVIPEAERMITQALLTDSRITAVDNFSFDRSGKAVSVSFDVHTIYGKFSEVINDV